MLGMFYWNACPSERLCHEYLAKMRGGWPDRFACPLCGEPFPETTRSRGRISCSNPGCVGYEESLTSNTLIHATKTKLATWIEAGWYISQAGIPEDRWSLMSRLSITRKVSDKLLSTFRCAMGAINNRTVLKDSAGVQIEFRSPGGSSYIGFILEQEDGFKRLKASLDPRNFRELHPLPEKQKANLLEEWERRLASRRDRPQSRGELPLFLEEFVFLRNHRNDGQRGRVFYELTQALVTTAIGDKPLSRKAGEPSV
jgi:hypothetical protein